MSGGHFNYDEYRLIEMAESIDILLEQSPHKMNEYGDRLYYGYNQNTLEEFRKTATMLREAYKRLKRIDYLVSGDDSEYDFNCWINSNV
jgi:hypothetical protein